MKNTQTRLLTFAYNAKMDINPLYREKHAWPGQIKSLIAKYTMKRITSVYNAQKATLFSMMGRNA